MMKNPLLRVGTTVVIVFENEINTSNAHYMKALVYDYQDKKIIISQTSPALNRNFLNRRIMVTFLANVDSRLLRFGFSAKLMDLVTVDLVASNKLVEALIIEPLADPKQIDFRMYFRIKPNLESGISLLFREQKVNLIDISLGGAKFVSPSTYLFRVGDTINIRLIIDASIFNLNARICEVRTAAKYSATITIRHVSIQFLDVSRQMENSLDRAIIKFERQLLSGRKV